MDKKQRKSKPLSGSENLTHNTDDSNSKTKMDVYGDRKVAGFDTLDNSSDERRDSEMEANPTSTAQNLLTQESIIDNTQQLGTHTLDIQLGASIAKNIPSVDENVNLNIDVKPPLPSSNIDDVNGKPYITQNAFHDYFANKAWKSSQNISDNSNTKNADVTNNADTNTPLSLNPTDVTNTTDTNTPLSLKPTDVVTNENDHVTNTGKTPDVASKPDGVTINTSDVTGKNDYVTINNSDVTTNTTDVTSKTDDTTEKSDKKSSQSKPKTTIDYTDESEIASRGGHKHTFVARTESYTCSFCYLTRRNPVQLMTCGHSFCRSCWISWHKVCGGRPTCILDSAEVDLSTVFPDTNQDRVIRGLEVACGNEAAGCGENPQLWDYETHLSKCDYEPIRCEQCEETVLRMSTRDHLNDQCPCRMITCSECALDVQARHAQDHETMCPMKVVGCEYCGEKDIFRKDLGSHQTSTCTKFPTYCIFALLGCDNPIVRDEMEAHHASNMRSHLVLMNGAVFDIYGSVGVSMPGSRGHVTSEGVTSDGRGTSSEIGSSDAMSSDVMLNNPTELPSELWASVGKNDSKTETETESGIASASGGYAPTNRNTSTKPRNLVELYRRLKSDLTVSETKIHDLLSQQVVDKQTRIEQNIQIEDLRERNDKMVTKCDELQISLNILTTELRTVKKDVEFCVKRNNGELIEGARNSVPCKWIIEIERGSGIVLSPPFYTETGYKMCLSVGWARPSMFGVSCFIVKGDNDDKLKWPWVGEESVSVSDADTGNVIGGLKVRPVGLPGRERTISTSNYNSRLFFNCFKCERKKVRLEVGVACVKSRTATTATSSSLKLKF